MPCLHYSLCANRKPRDTPVPLASLTVSLSDLGYFPRTSHNGYTALSSGDWQPTMPFQVRFKGKRRSKCSTRRKSLLQGSKTTLDRNSPCETSCLVLLLGRVNNLTSPTRSKEHVSMRFAGTRAC